MGDSRHGERQGRAAAAESYLKVERHPSRAGPIYCALARGAKSILNIRGESGYHAWDAAPSAVQGDRRIFSFRHIRYRDTG